MKAPRSDAAAGVAPTSPGPDGGALEARGAPGAGPPAGVVVIESLAAGGEGVGHLPDGMAVFVPRTAPGDRVAIGAVRRRRRYARATAGRVLAPGPDRVEPRCVHFLRDGCGGCQWQHLSAERQAAAKRRIVGDALRRIGALGVEDPPLIPSPRAFGYRGTVTLTVRWPGRAGPPVAGFHRGDEPDVVFPLERCEIAHHALDALWSALRPALQALPRGDDVRLKLRVGRDGGLHVVVGGGDGAWTTAQPLADVAKAAGHPATVWWQPRGGAPRRLAGPEADRGVLAFEQVNAEVAAAMRDAILGAVPVSARRVLDLYAGAGETGLAITGAGRAVVCVEVNESAVRHAAFEAQRTGVALEAVAARVEDVVGGLLPADAVIVNPPRTGLAPAVCAALRERPPERLIYVSCDPATLARDLRRMEAEAGRLQLTCYDMFPQTSHVETLAILRPREGRTADPAAAAPAR